ncbi:MAG: YHS domain-containing protein [Hyphomonadaceae bacterium]|nr:YHS domain-containing protein [Hyphomonadaceae bacterium]
MKLRILFAATSLALMPALALAPTAHADKAPVYTGLFNNLAVEGYDPVAYFTEGRPVRGERDYTTTYNGAEFRFSSLANLEAFKADPGKYAPQYGGYCAWAVSQGYTAKGDAQHWHIEDGKLYLNYNKSVQETWEEDIPGFISMADGNWPTVLD